MYYYAFKNIRNGKYISGTDFRTTPYRQILSDEYRSPKILRKCEIEYEMRHRQINPKTYKVVKVEIKEVTDDEC